jgi:hypothetical protein
MIPDFKIEGAPRLENRGVLGGVGQIRIPKSNKAFCQTPDTTFWRSVWRQTLDLPAKHPGDCSRVTGNFPGSYHTGSGRQFAIGFEGANVVRDVFVRDKGNADAAVADLTAASPNRLRKKSFHVERVASAVEAAVDFGALTARLEAAPFSKPGRRPSFSAAC